MAKGKKIRFIYNPNSGLIHPINILKRLIAKYFPKNLCYYDITPTESKGHARVLSRQAVEQGYDIVVGIGGDGTINEVALPLVNTDVLFGIIPNGSGNGFARGLGVPLNVLRSVKLVTTGEIRVIDVGKVNDKYFFTTSGFGFDAVVGQKIDEFKIRGPAPYYAATVTEFLHYAPPEYEITFDGKTKKLKALLVAVANIRQYGFNAIIAPNAKPDDGLLDLVIVRPAKILPTVYHLPKLFTGQFQKVPNVEQFQGKEFKIKRKGPGVYHLDGEVFNEKQEEIDVTIIPQALKVIVSNTSY